MNSPTSHLQTLKSALAIAIGALILTACASDSGHKPGSTAETDVKAYGRFVPERRDDFAWENDKVAFRVYGPAAPFKGHSSGVDAWLKKVDYSIIDKWYKAHTEGVSYHIDHGEGYDPYHTGISRGVGATAIWVEGKPYTAHTYKSYEVIESGKDVIKFQLDYDWSTPLGQVHEKKVVSLPLGSQLFTVNSVFTLDGKPSQLPIAIGIATHDEKAKVFHNKSNGRISAWEIIDDLGIGTGVVINPTHVESIKHIPSDIKDESHIWLFTKTSAAGALEYHAGFAWEGAKEITTQEAWHTYLDRFLTQ